MNANEHAIANRILEIKAGSHLYGTNVATSDEDFVGIFMPHENWVFGLERCDQADCSIVSKLEGGKNAPDAVDRKLYELRNFVRLALDSSPNCLEVLFASEESIVYCNELGRRLLAANKLFASKKALARFIGYAHGQKHKMAIKKEHYEALCTAALVFETWDPREELQDAYKKLLSSKPSWISKNDKSETLIDIGDLHFYIGMRVKDVRGQIVGRLGRITNRIELITKHAYDVKFAGHLVRLLGELEELLRTGSIVFPLKERETILAIRRGEWTIDRVLNAADELEARCEVALATSPLPATPNYNTIQQLIIDMVREHMR